MPSPTCQIKK